VCLSNTGVPYNVSPVTGAVAYVWSSGNGAQLTASGATASVDFRGTVGSSVVITAAVANGCGTGPSSVYPVLVNRSCRVSSEFQTSILYPNPATDEVHLRIGEMSNGSCILEVFDLLGNKVTEQKIGPQGEHLEVTIRTSDWTPGMYVIRLHDASGGVHREFRFIKE
jgi:hypothetical protein